MSKIIVIDLESTCWKDAPPAGQKSEIIEIGICVLDTADGKITLNQGLLIKPENSEVSPFCTELTSLTTELLEKEGVTFTEACKILKNEYQANDLPWASYGNYDKNMMTNQCKSRSIVYPLSEDHINVKTEFSIHFKTKAKGMARALNQLNIELEGTHHRGKDDAKNIAKILFKIHNKNKA